MLIAETQNSIHATETTPRYFRIKIVIASIKLPDNHKDPCDRFIIATAILNNLPIIKKDKLFER
jgi:PIN domain nuclease of toxin-antitoxin system